MAGTREPRPRLSLPRFSLPARPETLLSIRSGLRELEAGLVPAGQQDHAGEEDHHEDHLAPPRADRAEGAPLDLALDLAEEHRPAEGEGQAVEAPEDRAGGGAVEDEQDPARPLPGHGRDEDTTAAGPGSGVAPGAAGDPLEGVPPA